ncbi:MULTISPECIES: metallophosphoesterase family protein [unclassified Nocardia]|uniref:metallophosphoesterase family protein n=1 Tax=unclassified Nocardia TaxID=2637762 RepID=UPI00278BB993|nr:MULTISPECIES: metallophosphoesterase family protein [unclassified Nocardia]
MSRVFYTSDLHLGHRRVAELRGFDSTSAHDDYLADIWDSAIGQNDHVWVLGDISLGGAHAEWKALAWLDRRPGVKWLVPGNHDTCHPLHSQAHRRQREFLIVFQAVQTSAIRKIAGRRVRLSHFPFRDDPHGDHTPEIRYPEHRLPDVGEYLLHGHTHSAVKTRGRQIHIGLDAHDLTPVPQSWVEDYITTHLEQQGATA